jgi:CheY-like chemotaxis protein
MMKTLIAEHDRDLRETLSLLLRNEGYDVVAAGSGVEAWYEFEHRRFSWALSDWLMPHSMASSCADAFVRLSVRTIPTLFC